MDEMEEKRIEEGVRNEEERFKTMKSGGGQARMVGRESH